VDVFTVELFLAVIPDIELLGLRVSDMTDGQAVGPAWLEVHMPPAFSKLHFSVPDAADTWTSGV
jgi:hypothetical protein